MVFQILSRFFAAVGALVVGGIGIGHAQPHAELITMHRGMVAHSIYNSGLSGKFDIHRKQGGASFSYPPGRQMRVYSGGTEREGWNAKSNGAGEGVWILSKLDGVSHVTAAGSEIVTDDVIPLNHQPQTWPEGYLGVVHHAEYALATRTAEGKEAAWTDGILFVNAKTNWWRGEGGMPPSQTPSANEPVVMWNFRFNEYNNGTSYRDRILAGEIDQAQVPLWAENLSDDDFPEVVGITQAKSSESGLMWTRKWHQWGHQDYNKFLINETILENDSGETRTGVYIVLQNRFWQSASGAWRDAYSAWSQPYDWSSDNHARSTLASNYLQGVSRPEFLAGDGKPMGAQIGKTLAESGHPMLYAHDGESLHFTNVIQDVGDPFQYARARSRYVLEQNWVNEGFLNHSQYFGVGVVDAMPPFHTYGGLDPEVYVAPEDNPNTLHDERVQQPASMSMWQYTNKNNVTHPALQFDGPDYVYDMLTQVGYMDEPDEASAYSQFMVFGPYTLHAGEKAKVVVAYVGGMGADDPKFDDYKRYGRPFNFEWLNLGLGVGHSIASFSQRQQDIPLGEDAMFRHFQNAIDAYNWGYDIPNQPPSIKVAFEWSKDGHNVLKWSAFGEDAEDPDYSGAEARDLRGYRLYRSETEHQGPWEMVAEFSFDDAREGRLSQWISYHPTESFHTVPTHFAVGGSVSPDQTHPNGIPLTENRYVGGFDANAGNQVNGLYRWTDSQSKLFKQHWYAVRAYDAGHSDWLGTGKDIPVLESAAGASGGTVIGHTWGIIPFPAGSGVFDRLEAKVKFVPNPYKADSNLRTVGGLKILSIQNLPARAKIEFYDVSGQLIGEHFHNSVVTSSATWAQTLFNGGDANGGNALAPGIYFWRVTSLMPENMGDVQKGTFLIIK